MSTAWFAHQEGQKTYIYSFYAGDVADEPAEGRTKQGS